MTRTINIIRRIGSKQNDLRHFKHLLPLEVDTIIEPFGGSFAVSKYFYKDNKYKFHINDLDEELYYIYINYEEYLKQIDVVNDMADNLDLTLRGHKLKNYIEELDINDNIKNYIIKNMFVRGNIFKCSSSKSYEDNEIYILNNGLFTNDDYINIFNKYKDDDKAFIFLDPPYLFSDNSGYFPQNEEKDMTSILIDILDLLINGKCKVMLIINKLNIIEFLFKDFIKGIYQKTYQISKKKMKHLIITNY